jgi:hypothetical protein
MKHLQNSCLLPQLFDFLLSCEKRVPQINLILIGYLLPVNPTSVDNFSKRMPP